MIQVSDLDNVIQVQVSDLDHMIQVQVFVQQVNQDVFL